MSITFIDRDGDEQTVQAKIGDTLLEVAKEFDIDRLFTHACLLLYQKEPGYKAN